jgi:hypothetical protein
MWYVVISVTMLEATFLKLRCRTHVGGGVDRPSTLSEPYTCNTRRVRSKNFSSPSALMQRPCQMILSPLWSSIFLTIPRT